MAAYVISDLAIADADAFAVYRTRAAASIANHGGRYLARGGEITPSKARGRHAPSSS